MINSNQVLADFQFMGSRVSSFKIDTKDIKIDKETTNVTYDFDYEIKEVKELEDGYIGYLEFTTRVKAKFKGTIFLKIDLTMEGAFTGRKLEKEKFINMLELNGLTVLSQLSRAYILSVTALSGITPPVKLPMINVFRLMEKKRENDTNNK